jgi:hypothetical protein
MASGGRSTLHSRTSVYPALREGETEGREKMTREILSGRAGGHGLVDAVDDSEPGLTTLRLACIADDAQGEQVEIL